MGQHLRLDQAAASAGPDQNSPVANVTRVMGVGSAVGSWTRISGTGTITSPNNPNSTITGLGVGLNLPVVHQQRAL
jgi:hypothetical protein